MGEGTKVGEGFNVLRSGISICCIKYKAPITTKVVSSNPVQSEVSSDFGYPVYGLLVYMISTLLDYLVFYSFDDLWFMVFNATFNNI
jgi:hypothetical protein